MGRPLAVDVAGQVIGLWRAGHSYRHIADELNIHRNTVYGVVKRYNQRRTVVPRKSTGRRKLTTPRDDRSLIRIVQQNRRMTVPQLRQEWQRRTNVNVSESTVTKRLKSSGYIARRLVKVPKLTIAAKRTRRTWAQRHQNRTVQQWRHLVFCDESRFLLTRADGRIRVRRRNGEALNEDCVQGQVAHGGGSVRVWGGVHYLGKTQLRILEQNVTGALYREILEQDLVSHMRNHYGNNWMLVDDNARPHRANIVREYLTGEDINQLEWPPYSPDMNPIEHMWDELGRRLEGVHPQPQTLQELGQVLSNLWDAIPIERTRALVDSMPHRVQALVAARGGNTRY